MFRIVTVQCILQHIIIVFYYNSHLALMAEVAKDLHADQFSVQIKHICNKIQLNENSGQSTCTGCGIKSNALDLFAVFSTTAGNFNVKLYTIIIRP